VGSSAAWFAGLVAERWSTGATFAMLAGIAVALSLVILALVASAERRRREVAVPSIAGASAGD
jgi:hypothetical protein